MTNSKPTELDHVLEEYALASEAFDATVLHCFIEKYPEHAQPLRRYAQVQLTFVQPTREEVEAEKLTDEEMLPQQSKLLQRMQQLLGTPSSADVAAVGEKLAAISGEAQILDVARAIFVSTGHGEDLLLISVTDSSAPVKGVPNWFYDGLGSSIGCPTAVVAQALSMKRQTHTGAQRFSTQGKLAELASITWEQLVEDCISDEEVKKQILKRS
ncbi:hypothetical protein [Variovorax paradoxus]|uniref:hypothetical protein n=1 Tax=Variovorax paradoxus TaxID=34073 RepID=UPI0029C7283A|nr:hypothetical protein [Variovorax paradoxus]WPH19868.1 hypothetical protein RZE78_22985 [Variovorax paradoxus]